MENYIKYQRFVRELNGDADIQTLLDEMSAGGWDILYYNEHLKDVHTLVITIVAGKRQSTIL